MKFDDLRLSKPLLCAIATEGYCEATPIQALAIPHVMAGRDVLGIAQTGTGKTAAFALPVLHRLAKGKGKEESGRKKRSMGKGYSGRKKGSKVRARCLVLCPTRELAKQIAKSFAVYGKHMSVTGTVIFGGVNQRPQVNALRSGVDVIVATPGRLMDLMNQGYVDLSGIETFILDEADRMLDMGFIHDIERIVEKLPAEKQTLLFSATMPGEIRKLSARLLVDPETIAITPERATVDTVDQSVFFVSKQNKPDLLSHFLEETSISRALVFTRTKHGADRVVKQLRRVRVIAEAIHGNKSQNVRERALMNFTQGRTHVLVATDIASRGIDVDGISHVINYDLTHEPETYVHRIGRTARAGASGFAVSFCDPAERGQLRSIERLIRKTIVVREDGPAYTMSAQTMQQEGESRSSGSGRTWSKRGGKRRSDRPRVAGQGKSKAEAARPSRGAARGRKARTAIRP